MASAIIVVPCYNEGHRLDVATFRAFAAGPHVITFLFVNDGSTDNTRGVIESLTASEPDRFRVLNLQRNCGKAEAVRQGVLESLTAKVDYVGFWDADLATPLSTIREFIEVADARPDLEVIIGSRVKLLGRDIERRPARHYSGRVFATAASVILGLPVYDTQCGAKLFRCSSTFPSLFDRRFVSRWVFDVEILARLIEARRRSSLPQPEHVVYESPLRQWHDVPGSKVRWIDFARSAWDLLRIRARYRLR
jgi:glycosyltransferase involved in cell wall biosynthesis